MVHSTVCLVSSSLSKERNRSASYLLDEVSLSGSLGSESLGEKLPETFSTAGDTMSIDGLIGDLEAFASFLHPRYTSNPVGSFGSSRNSNCWRYLVSSSNS